MHIYDMFSPKELEILEARARRIAGATRDDQQVDRQSALMITIGNESYALPIESLKAVYERIAIIPVPCVPSFVAGMTNIRGHITPVLELSVLLNAPTIAVNETNTVVVASNGSLTVAFRVEAIGEVMNFAVNEISPVPGNFDAARADYLQGVLLDGTGLLDVEHILSDSALIVDESLN